MKVPKSKVVRIREASHKIIKALSESEQNRYNLTVAQLTNLAVDRGLPALKKEFGK